MKETLYEKLKRYERSDYYGFHMPGHKRNRRFADILPACGIDITEIEGFDDLHHADGILKEAQDRAAGLFGADETHFLINGSTVGILSAVLGVTDRGDRILVARNCHKSVYHAVEMNELEPVYLYPAFDREMQLNTEISAIDVRKSLEEDPQIRAVVIVSPTYDGVVSDVAAIAAAVHEKGLPLIVDEAHGAHFGFHPYFPQNANQNGADIIIHSLHKTLPSPTQTALLHINGRLVNRRRVRKYLHMLQSSSPSYILMAGMDSCIHMLENEKETLFLPYVKQLHSAREALSSLKALRLVPPALRTDESCYDRSKILISTVNTGITGKELYDILLTRYHLQLEMKTAVYVIAMTSPADTPEAFGRLIRALTEIDARLSANGGEMRRPGLSGISAPLKLPRIYTPAEAARLRDQESPAMEFARLRDQESPGMEAVCPRDQESPAMESACPRDQASSARGAACRSGHTKGNRSCPVNMPFAETAGCISLEYVYLYPPGTPIIVPGEIITEQAVCLMDWYTRSGYTLEGPGQRGHIEVIPSQAQENPPTFKETLSQGIKV